MQPDASHRIVLGTVRRRSSVRCVRPFRAAGSKRYFISCLDQYILSLQEQNHHKPPSRSPPCRFGSTHLRLLLRICEPSKRLVHTLQLLLCEIPFLQIIDFPSATERASYPLLSSAGWLQDVVEWSWTVHVWIATTDERGHTAAVG